MEKVTVESPVRVSYMCGKQSLIGQLHHMTWIITFEFCNAETEETKGLFPFYFV